MKVELAVHFLLDFGDILSSCCLTKAYKRQPSTPHPCRETYSALSTAIYTAMHVVSWLPPRICADANRKLHASQHEGMDQNDIVRCRLGQCWLW